MDSFAKLPSFLVDLGYMFSVVFFILGMKWMSHPSSARRGNFTAALGMGIAVLATLIQVQLDFDMEFLHFSLANYLWMFSGLLLGSLIGLRLSSSVKMTDMPQMVSLLNGLGGAAAMLVVLAEVFGDEKAGVLFDPEVFVGMAGGYYTVPLARLSREIYYVLLMLNLVAGAVAFTGSIMAMGKLQGFVPGGSVRWPLQRLTNNGFLC